ncbi:hypothetical protein ZS55_004495 [Salmonella enterica subsp. salamae]|nr:hypothetical protein [Salmonella enterica subsp. salamae]
MSTGRVLYMSLFLISGSVFAGGGGTSWSPSVMPINCIVSKSTDSGAWTWNNSAQCNDVIKHNYARGVRYSGQFVYKDGSVSYFDSIITPETAAQYKHYGKTLDAIKNNSANWEK